MTVPQSILRTGLGSTGLALLLLARASSAQAAGPTPVADFAASAAVAAYDSRAELDDVLGCFVANARLPSFAHVARYPDAAVVRLRFDGLVFETLEFGVRPGGGTQVRVALSGNYDRRDRAHFARARGAPLVACLAPAPVAVAAASGAAIAQ